MGQQNDDIRVVNVTLDQALNGQHYKIDYYQREYEWDNKQALDLIEDLLIKFKESYNEKDSGKDVLNYKQYFLGSFVVSNKDNDDYIIDGQQRLTTLGLIFLCLFKKSKEHGIEDISDSEKYVYSKNFGDKEYNVNVENRIAVMDYILNNHPDNNSDPFKTNNLFINYLIIENKLNVDTQFLKMFYYWLTNRVVMVKITAYDDNEAYTIFESMNDRGKELSNLDMMKGFLLSLVEENDRQKCITIWKKIEEGLGSKKFSQFIIDFFRAKWALTSPKDSKKDPNNYDWFKINNKFHRWFKENRFRDNINIVESSDIIDLFYKLEYFAKIYSKIQSYKENMTEGFEDLCYLYYQNVYHVDTLIMGLIDFNDSNVDLKIKIISKFLSIRIAHYAWIEFTHQDTNMADLIVPLLKSIRKDPNTKDIDGLIWFLYNELRGKINDSWGDFSLESVPKFGNGKAKQRVFALLSIMTYFLEKKGNGNASFESICKTNNVEHVLASNYEVNKSQFSTQEELDYVRNQIGGLGTLEKDINSSLNNSDYSTKVAKYPNYNKLLGTLNKRLYSQAPERVFENQPGLNSFVNEYPQLKSLFKSYSVFNKDSIYERNKLYSELCKIIWDIDDLISYCEIGVKSFDELDEYIDGDFSYFDESDNDFIASKEKKKLKIINSYPYILKDSLGNHIEEKAIRHLYSEWIKILSKNNSYRKLFHKEKIQEGKLFKNSDSKTAKGIV